jgi:hypothetical protein
MALPTEEKTLLAFDPIKRIVPTTTARTTANMTAYSATSCPSSASNLHKASFIVPSRIVPSRFVLYALFLHESCDFEAQAPIPDQYYPINLRT